MNIVTMAFTVIAQILLKYFDVTTKLTLRLEIKAVFDR
jgi:hypothetical protein